jgi:hypothetical protein
MRVEDDQQQPGDGRAAQPEQAHAEWAPPEYYTPSGERRAEPPGPVGTPGHYDTGPAEEATGTAAEEAALEDVDGGEFPPDDVQTQTVRTDTGDGGTYGHPVPAGEGGPDEPAVGVAQVPAESPDEPARRAEPAPETAGPETTRPEMTGPESATEPAQSTADAEAERQPETERVPEPEAGPEAETGPEAAEELAPGEVPAETVAAFWQMEVVDGFRDRWQLIQLRFIDDPRQAAEQAQALVTDVIQGFADAAGRRRDELNRWQSAQLDDTEELRMTVRRYRDLLDRLLAL